jgi:hypothetical protein
VVNQCNTVVLCTAQRLGRVILVLLFRRRLAILFVECGNEGDELLMLEAYLGKVLKFVL